jgi:hypothetical protein
MPASAGYRGVGDRAELTVSDWVSRSRRVAWVWSMRLACARSAWARPASAWSAPEPHRVRLRLLRLPSRSLASSASAVAGETPPAGPEWRRGALPLAHRPVVFERPLCVALGGRVRAQTVSPNADGKHPTKVRVRTGKHRVGHSAAGATRPTTEIDTDVAMGALYNPDSAACYWRRVVLYTPTNGIGKRTIQRGKSAVVVRVPRFNHSTISFYQPLVQPIRPTGLSSDRARVRCLGRRWSATRSAAISQQGGAAWPCEVSS